MAPNCWLIANEKLSTHNHFFFVYFVISLPSIIHTLG